MAHRYCNQPEARPRAFAAGVSAERARLIRRSDKKWVNGTVLHYAFLEKPARWKGSAKERRVVRDAFAAWSDLGIGIEFREVDAPGEAEVRIAFRRGDGAWSYVGRDVLGPGADDPTMNFGWDITRTGEIDTAIHEIGHTLGFAHEHQNPIAGIVWNEEVVYRELAGPPNRWDRQTTFHNIIRKIEPDSVQGSRWDPDSIMHYPFGPGLIDRPVKYRDGLDPAPGLSTRDRSWVRKFYPPLAREDHKSLEPLRSVRIKNDPGEQSSFVFEPEATRSYTIGTFGPSDSVLALFEDVDGQVRYVAADDDSGEDANARIRAKLFRGRSYFVRVRVYCARGDLALMIW